jgi:hypothetical protein
VSAASWVIWEDCIFYIFSRMSFYTAWVINRNALIEHFPSAICSENGPYLCAPNAAWNAALPGRVPMLEP